MKQRCIIIIMLICLMPGVAKAQWTFDVLSVEAYINDHKKQRSLLLARSTLELFLQGGNKTPNPEYNPKTKKGAIRSSID